MTLDETIEYAEQMVEIGETYEVSTGVEEYRQLVAWLKELKDYRERIPSYEAGYNDAKREIALSGEYERCYERGKADAQPKIGHWIFKNDNIAIPMGYYQCSECEGGKVLHKDNFCPTCGTNT